MRWRNFTNPVQNEKVRVTGACAAACGTDDVYRLRVYETTLRAARFNNSGPQTTVVVLQNPGDDLSAPVFLRSYLPFACVKKLKENGCF
jgi:hypothetical protein